MKKRMSLGKEDSFLSFLRERIAEIGKEVTNSLGKLDVKKRVLDVISDLQKDYWLERDIENYQNALDKELSWFDTPTFLNWYAHHFKPTNFLEVGVRRGRSMSQVLVESPETKAYGFDLWMSYYASILENGVYPIVNPGAAFVIGELKKLGVINLPLLIDGNSHETLPAFWSDANNPEQFELINIDGDHSYEGAKLDLDIAFEHLAPGGALVFDDINHPTHPELKGLWDEYKVKFADYLFIEDSYVPGSGIAFRPPFDKLEKLIAKPSEKLRMLLVYSLHPSYGKITLPEWIKEALRKYFSHEVKVFACGPDNEINIPDSIDFYEHVGRVVNELNIDVLWDIEGGGPSLDFMFKRFPKSVSIPKILWAVDTHQFLPLQTEKAKYFDLVFSVQKDTVSSFGTNAIWLPGGVALHEKDYQLPRTIAVGFIGNVFPGIHDQRRQTLEYLAKEIKDFKFYTQIFLDDKARLNSQMKIMVNVSLRQDINFRVFETLACGAMLITDKIHNNGMEELFVDGKHLVTFETKEELVEKIRYYLEHEDERKAIARSGQDRVNSLFRHNMILSYALPFIKQFVEKKTLQQKINNPAAFSTNKTCWCGGELEESVHPLYGQCLNCKTLVVKKHYTEEELKKFYTMDGYWHDQMVNVHKYPPIEQRAVNDFRDRIPAWYQILIKYKPDVENLLEIGCAHGGFLHYCRERGVKNVVGVEVDENTCAFAREHFNLPYVISGLFPDVSLPFQKFDAITGFDVVEHFLNPINALSEISNLLKNDGVCVFQIPCYRGEGKNWTQFKPDEHVFLYNAENIQLLFEQVGIETIGILPGYFPDDMFFIGQKKSSTDRIRQRKRPSIEKLDNLKVIVDGVFFQFYHTGIARVWVSLLQEWITSGFAKHLLLLDRAGSAPKIPGIKYRTIPPYDYSKTDADRQMLQQVCDQERADLLISTYYTTPLSTPSVFIAHDMIPEIFGANLNDPMWREKHYGIQHASAYITVSERTARDLRMCFPDISPELVTVAHNGVSRTFSPASVEEVFQFKSKYSISKPYFLWVGGRGGYKNGILFFQAFSQFEQKGQFEIVCTGIPGLEEDLKTYASGSAVHMLQLTDEELRIAYSGAVALIYPSRYEGFGLPVLEAMACGCPVITTPNGAIPEVAGAAALYVHDNDVAGLVNGFYEIQKPAARQALITAGLEQAKKFSWSKMADIISSVLIKVATNLKTQSSSRTISTPPVTTVEESLLNRPVSLQDLMGQPQEKLSGAELFIQSLGDTAQPFIVSLTSPNVQELLTVEQTIAASSLWLPEEKEKLFQYHHSYPNDGYLNLWSGLVRQQYEQHSEAISNFINAINSGCNHWRVAWYLAQSAEKINDLVLAKNALQAILQVEPNFEPAQERWRCLKV